MPSDLAVSRGLLASDTRRALVAARIEALIRSLDAEDVDVLVLQPAEDSAPGCGPIDAIVRAAAPTLRGAGLVRWWEETLLCQQSRLLMLRVSLGTPLGTEAVAASLRDLGLLEAPAWAAIDTSAELAEYLRAIDPQGRRAALFWHDVRPALSGKRHVFWVAVPAWATPEGPGAPPRRRAAALAPAS